MIKNKQNSFTKTISDMNLNLGIGIMSMGIIGGLMGKMSGLFGTLDIPQGVVREMMEGVMDGLISHFEIRIDDLKRDVEMKTEEIGKLKERISQLEEKSSKTTQKSK